MDIDDLDPIDILAFTTDELRNRFVSEKNPADQATVILEFLQSWDADPSLHQLKKLKVKFEKDLDWFNVSHSLSIDDLNGKLVVLDFFTYCCINCMHVFPELKAIEERFSIENGLVVVGIHSPKFQNEKDSANILSAINRYNLTHPIVNDPHSQIWNSLHIKCWPTLLVLTPSGAPLLLLMGEGHRAFLEKFIEHSLQYFTNKKQIKKSTLPISISTTLTPASSLKFPAKIARLQQKNAKENEQRFAIADAGNNRILIMDGLGVITQRIGGCEAGLVDGEFEVARFNAPQGVSFVNDDILVVADTENHAIRQIILSTKQVKTLVGTGIQGTDRIGGKIGNLQEISSPWDVTVFKTRDMDMSFHIDEQKVPEKIIVLIAMAGTHQIWGYFEEGIIWWKFKKFEPLTCVSLIGNGLEENRNNSYPQNAAFAQPSGLAMAKEFLFIADSESSSIRKASMVDGKVMAVVGGDRNPLNLFAFGDVDGKQYNAKLQHPLGVTYNHYDNKIYVADTYNHKIKSIDIETNTIETCQIKDEQQQPYKFNEPAGLCCDESGENLLVADTNNHNIQVIDLKTMRTRRLNLNFTNIINVTEDSTAPNSTSHVQLRKSLPLYGCKKLNLNVGIALKDKFKFTPDAPQKWSINANNFSMPHGQQFSGQILDGVCNFQLQRIETEVDSVGKNPSEEIKLDFSLNLCDDKSCTIRKFSLILTTSNNDGRNTSVSNESLDEKLNLDITKSSIKLS